MKSFKFFSEKSSSRDDGATNTTICFVRADNEYSGDLLYYFGISHRWAIREGREPLRYLGPTLPEEFDLVTD